MTDKNENNEVLTESELKEMITNAVGPAIAGSVQEEVAKAIAPLTEKQENFMESVTAQSMKKLDIKEHQKGIAAARFVRAMAFGRGDQSRAKYFCDKAFDDGLGDLIGKSLMAGDFTAGGALIPPEFAGEIIELLRSRAVVRSAGPRVLPMNSGTLTIRKQTAGSSSSYVGESQNISSTEPTSGQIVLTSKKLAAIVPISNDLLTFSAGDTADEFVRDDLVMEIAVREDQAFIRDTGLSDTPKGLRYWAPSGNVTASAGTSSANIETDFKVMINDLEQADVRMIRPVWFMAPRSKNHLVNLRDANGNLIFPEIRSATPTLYGFPVFITTNIPVNLGGGSNETELYLVDMADVIIGEATDLEIAVDGSASYIDSNSNLVSAFARDETLMRAISRHDLAVRHEESVSVINAVTWGA